MSADIVRRINEAILGMVDAHALAGLLFDAKAEITRLRDGATLAGLLDQADDVWTDYGSGFRIHFSFPPSHESDVVLRINRRRSRAREALATQEPRP